VLARYVVRAREIAVSVVLIEHLSSRSESGRPHNSQLLYGALGGLGVVEHCRGTICHRHVHRWQLHPAGIHCTGKEGQTWDKPKAVW